MGAAGERVKIQSTHVVIPAKPTPPAHHLHFLSNFDLLYSQLFYDPMLFYFKAGAHSIQSFKRSLSQVLVHFPVLAGRVRPGDDGRLVVDCNDQGIVLVEAVADARLDEWKSLVDCPLEKHLNVADTSLEDYTHAPLLRIQVTSFQCGGLAIGYGWCHVCIDSPSAIHFMQRWCEEHRGLTVSSERIPNTRLLKARSPPCVRHLVKDYVAIPRNLETDENDANPLLQKSDHLPQVRTFSVKEDALRELLQEVREGSAWKCETPPTIFECVAALSWKIMTEAREMADEAFTAYSYPIDAREIWLPSLAANSGSFFGNATHLSCVKANAGEIKRNHISYAAKVLREDRDAASSDYLHSVVDFLQREMDEGKSIGFNSDFFGGRDVQGTDFSAYPIYDMDFGDGRPLHYSFTLDPMFGDGIAVIFPAPPQNPQERLLTISMAASHLHQLLQHPLCHRFLLR